MSAKRSVTQVILEVLGAEPDRKFSYEELYRLTCHECGRRLSKRDFQKSIDMLHGATGRLILIEVDPSDRRRKRIQRALPFDEDDYPAILESRLRGFLTDQFRKEPWLIPIDVWLYTEELLVNAARRYRVYRLTPREFILQYAWWRKCSEQEARDVISLGKLNGPLVRKCRRDRDRKMLKTVASEFREASIEANVKEILAALREGRAVNRENIITEIRKAQAALRKRWMNA